MKTIAEIKKTLDLLEKHVLTLKTETTITKEELIELIKTKKIINNDILFKFKDDYDVNMAYFVSKKHFFNDNYWGLFERNEKFFLEAVEKGAASAWYRFHTDIVCDENLFKEVIKKEPSIYSELRENLKVNIEYNELLLKEGADVLFYMNDEFRNNNYMVDLFLDNVKNPDFKTIYIPEKLKDDASIIIKYIRLYGSKINYDLMDEKLFLNYDFIIKAKEICPEFIDNLPFKFLKNLSLIKFLLFSN